MDWGRYFSYDSSTGELIWKERPVSDFSNISTQKVVNSRLSGFVAGTTMANGRKRVFVSGKPHYIHRIIWEMHYGPIPKGMEIDHVDLDPSNNRIRNLRVATRSQNNANILARKNSKTGVKGVHFCKKYGIYVAQISKDGKLIKLGNFHTLSDATMAYNNASVRLHGDFGRPNIIKD